MPPLDTRIDIDRIPTLPAIAMEAIRLMEGEESSFDSVADLIKSDQVLSGRLLHYANCAYVGAQSEVTTIARAISLLGFNTVRGIILSVAVFDCFSGPMAAHREELVNFWVHSIGVAALAEKLARRLGFADPETAYLAGLVHDMGKLVCFVQFPEEFTRLCQELGVPGGYRHEAPSALEVETEALGLDHTEAGREVARQWRLPAPLAAALWLHHQPVFEPITPTVDHLPQLVRFADVLAVCHNIGTSYFLAPGAYDHHQYHFALENLLRMHDLDAGEVEEMVDDVLARVREIGNVLGYCDQDLYRSLVGTANVSLGNMSLNLERRNRELQRANQVLDATCAMTRRLKSGTGIDEAITEILHAARAAFGVRRCLCMVVDHGAGHFVGRVYADGEFSSFSVPVVARDEGDGEASSPIEAEAVRRLRQVSAGFASGEIMEAGAAEIVAGGRFMAGFFVADKHAAGRPQRVTGELMLDFNGQSDPGEEPEALARNFKTFAAAAAGAVERILMEKDLLRQSREMAEASRRMEESQRQLFHSHRLATVGRLAAGAAHEINNPLTIISLNLQVMDRMLAAGDGADLAEIGRRLKVIADQEQRISKIINQLMGFARPAEPQFGPAEISAMLDHVLGVIGDRVSMGKIDLTTEIEDDLPPVLVDATQIEQVLMNLLINANHAMPDGGAITITARRRGNDWVEVAVSDTGPGIPAAHLPKIFDPFFTTKKEGEGTGLGLAICHTIMEHNGGGLAVTSEEGKGATFTLAMPVDKGDRLRALKKAVDQKKPPVPEPQAVEECRILIVDDERLLNNMLQECLAAAGYEADGAYDGVEAIGKLRLQKYHLMLLDIRMPRKDGLEVLGFVREEYPDLPVIIITGLASVEEIKKTVKKGAYACLKKPFLLDTVLEKVRRALEKSCRPADRSA